MTDLAANATRARELSFNLTGPLSHEQVARLAELWLPEIRFHQRERFHPIDLELLFKAPVEVFDSLPPVAQSAFLVAVNGAVGQQHYKPPVVRNGSTVVLYGGNIQTMGADGTERLMRDVSGDTIYSHGASFERSLQFFGATDTLSGNAVPARGDPRRPAHDIVVRAEMRYLLDALRHYLQEDAPRDALWGAFHVEDVIIRSPRVAPGSALTDPRAIKRGILRDLVAAHETGNDALRASALQRLSEQQDWWLNQRAWDAIRFYAFLEFYFVYAYNDYPDYGDWPFVNEHEGDVEGCCVVFDRRALDRVAAGAPIEDVVAHTVITSVHEPSNDSDELKRLPVERDRARDDLVVYVAPGSHATYLTAGSHDVLDWEDILTDWPAKADGWLGVIAAVLYPAIFPFLLLTALVEHFVDAEDETTDDGIRVGPEATTPLGGTGLAHTLVVTPLSAINGGLNLYQAGFDPRENGLDPGELGRRAFPGRWGGHDGVVNHSSKWEDKTTRYFRKFVESGEILGDVVL